MKEYGGKVRVVYKNMVVHPQVVQQAHLAACAAAQQKKFLEFKEQFWEKGFNAYAQSRDPSKMGEATIMAIAGDLKLDMAKFKADIAGPECQARLQKDMAEMEKFHVNATPAFFINGQLIIGGMAKEQFKEMIDQKLKAAEASGVPAKDYYQKEILGKGEKKFRAKKDPKPS